MQNSGRNIRQCNGLQRIQPKAFPCTCSMLMHARGQFSHGNYPDEEKWRRKLYDILTQLLFSDVNNKIVIPQRRELTVVFSSYGASNAKQQTDQEQWNIQIRNQIKCFHIHWFIIWYSTAEYLCSIPLLFYTYLGKCLRF